MVPPQADLGSVRRHRIYDIVDSPKDSLQRKRFETKEGQEVKEGWVSNVGRNQGIGISGMLDARCGSVDIVDSPRDSLRR